WEQPSPDGWWRRRSIRTGRVSSPRHGPSRHPAGTTSARGDSLGGGQVGMAAR
ncbi:MAG: hypothetical protein AVDCRST_MAG19-1358, partial [uncultured Thermomicrobiales bacterium]